MANPKNFSNSSQYQLRHTLEIVSQDIPGNRTQIKVSAYVDKVLGLGFYTSELRPWSIKVDGSEKASGSTTYDFRNYNQLLLGTWTGWISHGSDGKKSVSVAASFSGYSNMGSSSTSESHTLTTIPREHTFKVSDFVIGKNSGITLNITKSATTFTSRVHITFKGEELSQWQTISGSGNQTITVSQAVTNAMLGSLPNSTSGTFQFICDTMSGSTVIGRKTVTAKGTIHEDIKPTVGAISFSDTSPAGSFNAGYWRNLTTIRATSEVSAGTGATLKSRTYSYAGQSRPITWGNNPTSGQTSETFDTTIHSLSSVFLTVVDSRGRVGKAQTAPIELKNYNPPTIEAFTASRYNSSDPTQIRFAIKASRQIMGDELNNQIRYRVRVEKVAGGTEMQYWPHPSIGTWMNFSSSNLNMTITPVGSDYSVPADGDYYLYLEVQDTIGSTSRYRVLLRYQKHRLIQIVKGKAVNFFAPNGFTVNGKDILRGTFTYLSSDDIPASTSRDWHNLKGLYIAYTGSAGASQGYPFSYGIVLHFTIGELPVFQIYFGGSTQGIYTRRFNSTQPMDWGKV